MDVLDFRDFYTTPLGHLVQENINEILHKIWPEFSESKNTTLASDKTNTTALAFGYPLPFLTEKSSQLAFMPAHMGVIGWPKNTNPRVALVEEDLFPLPDRVVDHLLVIHGLEVSLNPTAFLQECWRVLTAEGRLLVITPNRRSLWSCMDSTPLGRGRPYTMTQLSRILQQNSFTSLQCLRGLYTPPLDSNISLSFQHLFEKAGPIITRKFSGIVAIEAKKTVYEGAPAASYTRRLKVALASATATPSTANTHPDT